MQQLIIIRGIPSSGKSYLARKLISKFESEGFKIKHFEADMFFQDDNYCYHYNGNLIKYAHEWCFSNVLRELYINFVDVIIVSNTFTRVSEMQKYLDLRSNDINVTVTQPNTPWAFDAQKCFEKNKHNVPLETIQKMLARWEEYEWEKII